MAKIVATDVAPQEEIEYALVGESFTLSDGSYETDDRDVLVEAEAHPWLSVEWDRDESGEGTYRPDTVAPEDDALSSQNTEAFDPEAIARDREAVLGTSDAAPLAVESGRDQREVEFQGDVGVTLAADDHYDEDEER